MTTINNANKSGGKFHYSFLVFIACCSVTFVSVALWFSCNGLFYTPVSSHFGVGRGTFAVANTVMLTVFGLLSPVMGSLIEKYSFKKLLVGTLVLQVITYLIQAKAGSIYLFYFTGALHGVVQSLNMLLVVPTIINRWFAVRRGFFVGLASSMSGLGAMLWNSVAGSFLEANGWQATYVLYAALVALIPLPLVLIILKDHPEDKGLKPYGYTENSASESTPENAVRVNKGLTLSEAKKTSAYWMVAIMSLMIHITNNFTQYVPSYATSLGLSITAGATMASFVGFGVLIGKNTIGALFDKSPVMGITASTLIPTISFPLLFIFGRVAQNLLPVGTAMYGVSYAVNPVLLPLVVMHVFGTKEYGKIIGLINLYGSVLSALIGVVFGMISDIPGIGFDILLLVSAISSVTSMIGGILAVKKGRNLYEH